MSFFRLPALLLILSTLAACQAPGEPLLPQPSASPDPQPSPTPTALPTPAPQPTPARDIFPPGFPAENQLLASGERLGWGMMLNQLDAQGQGAVLWALGNPAGRHFADFKASTPIARGSLPGGGSLRWAVDAQGNGLLFESQLLSSVGNEMPPPLMQIWQVQGFATVGTPERRQADVLGLHTDAQGNGWVMLSEVAPDAPSGRLRHLYALQAYRLAEKIRTADTLQQGDVMDAEGNGFRVYSTYKEVGDSLWLQLIQDFEAAGEPVLLADNGGQLRVHVSEGQGLISWLVRDSLNRDQVWAFERVQNHRPAGRLPTLAVDPQSNALLLDASLDAAGNGLTLWNHHHHNASGPPDQGLSLQAMQQGQWQSRVVIRESAAQTYSAGRLAVDASGQGLLLWPEAPRQMNQGFLSNQGSALYSQALTDWQPSGTPRLISEASQASVDAWSLNLSPAGHGLIAWTQFNEDCPGDLSCNLAQSVWARAVYGFRMP